MPLRPLLLVLALAVSLALAACGSDDDASSSSSSTATTTAAACSKADLQTIAAGKLTVGTDKPSFPPYVIDDTPSNGKGFESALSYAVAKELGFSPAEVKWAVVPFNSSYAPGPKKFDFDINQISITPQREKVVDFSTPYYTAPQAVLALEGSDAASATDLAGLKDAKLGVQVGTTSLNAVNDVIQPSQQPQVFNDSNDTVAALKSGRVDAIVLDLPTAIYLRDAELDKAKVVGQFEVPGGDSWGLLTEKGSKLTTCLNQALASLKSSGQLQKITDQWMTSYAQAPELK
mgnify:CR=1 FL=1